MSTFNEFMKNHDAYTDLYTPLLYQEKGMKQGKEKFRAFNRTMRITSEKANAVGTGIQSSSEQIKLALTSFAGSALPVVQSINSIGSTINKKFMELNSMITGIKQQKPTMTQQPSSTPENIANLQSNSNSNSRAVIKGNTSGSNTTKLDEIEGTKCSQEVRNQEDRSVKLPIQNEKNQSQNVSNICANRPPVSGKQPTMQNAQIKKPKTKQGPRVFAIRNYSS